MGRELNIPYGSLLRFISIMVERTRSSTEMHKNQIQEIVDTNGCFFAPN